MHCTALRCTAPSSQDASFPDDTPTLRAKLDNYETVIDTTQRQVLLLLRSTSQ
jgi:hypothetical protein